MQPHDAPTFLSPLGSLIGRSLLGRYQLLDRLGSGGMATVFRGRDVRLGRLVAVKVLYAQYAGDEVFLTRFQREAEFAARLTGHPHIVSVYDVGRDGDYPFIVMELVEGPNLKDLILDDAPLPVERAFHIGGQVASALHFAHSHGLVHRDVKPHNILVSDGEQVKVTDFGIARHSAVSSLTRPGTVIGTADYISPEQARGQPATPASDVYALGVVLYEMLTARLPFAADTAVGIHLQEEPPSPHLVNPAVGPTAATVVMRALHNDPSQRFGSAAELAAAMEQVTAAGTVRTAPRSDTASATAYRPLAAEAEGSPELKGAGPSILRSPRSRLLASLAAALLAALLLVGWLARGVTSSHSAHSTPSPLPATPLPTSSPPQPAVVLHPNPTRTPTPQASATIAPSPNPTATTPPTVQPSPSPAPSVTSQPSATASAPAIAPPSQPPPAPGPGGDQGLKGHDNRPGGDHGAKGHADQGNPQPGPGGEGGDG